MEEEPKNESGASLVEVNSRSNANALGDKLKQKQDGEENQPSEPPEDEDENRGQGEGRGQVLGPTQSQMQYQQNMKGFNPCKCCCGGNLRQACFAIAILEILFCSWFIISIIFSSLQWKGDQSSSGGKNSTAMNMGKHVSSTYYLANIVVYSLLGLTLIGAITTMFIATIKRSKLCCLLHSGFALLVGIFYFSIFVLALVQLINKHSDGDECKPSESGSDSEGNLDSPKCQDGLFGPVGLVRLILRALFAALFVFLSVNSLALFLKYRKGILYENTPLQNCKAYCCCCKGKRGQEQGILEANTNANANGGGYEGQSKSQLGQSQSQIQSQSRMQSQNQSQAQLPKKLKNKNKKLKLETQSPPPEFNVNSTASLNPEPPANPK